jgi:hypothetical protein
VHILARDKIALIAAITRGPLFGFLATEFNRTYHRGIFLAALFVFLFIPAVVLLSERFKILVWQASVFSFATYVLAWNLRLQKISFNRDGAGLSFLQILFVIWTAGTIFSAPVPIYFSLRRIERPYRYYAVAGVTITGIVLWWLLKVLAG